MNGYLLQGIAIPLWWIAMAASERVYGYFAFPEIGRTALFSFVLPDAVLISALSIAVYIRPNRTLQACVLGAFAYGALWCVAASTATGGGFLSSIVMTLGALFNVMLLLGPDAFRMSRSDNRTANLMKTFVQSVVIWTVTLVVFPLGIVHAAGHWPLAIEPRYAIIGGIAFALCSTLGIWSGISMTVAGGGTPLPVDAPQRLVTAGPYGYVRNPMAIAGLGQGFSVALFLQSPEVAAYVVIGMLVWNYFVRPEEERYMSSVFGEEFDSYRLAVRCWFPTNKKYSVEPSRFV